MKIVFQPNIPDSAGRLQQITSKGNKLELPDSERLVEVVALEIELPSDLEVETTI